MKKKIISILLTAVLVCSLSVSAFAAGGELKPSTGLKAAVIGDPAEVAALMTTITANRATLLTIKAGNITLSSQLRTLLTSLKSSGAAISQETLDALKAIKDQLKATHQQLRDTVGQVESLMDTARQYRQAKDFTSAAAALQQVITIQQTRITLETQIGTLTQQMIDLLSAV